jgi:hypothetical protein
MLIAGNVPTAKMANCHARPVALLPRLVAVATHPGVTILAGAPEPAKEATQTPIKKATSAIPHSNLRHRPAISKRLWIPLNFERHRMAI